MDCSATRVESSSPARPSRAKKSLGQHFLADRRYVNRIIDAAKVTREDLVVEIGPGRGILTRELAKHAGRVIAVELDSDLVQTLTDEFADLPHVSIVEADAREASIDAIVQKDTPYKLVANLPYYAASPIVRRFLEENHKPQLMVVMLQREVAENMAASPGSMSVLSVATQLYGRPRVLFNVPPRAFRPAPKVTSSVIRIDVYTEPALPGDSEDDFFTLVKAGFSSKRKQIHNCIQHGLSMSRDEVEAMLVDAGIDPKRRAETLSMEEWGRLYDRFRGRVVAD